MNSTVEKARAKVNLVLDVLNKRPDGYHNIGSLFQTLDLAEDVILEKVKEPGVHLKSFVEEGLLPEKNLLYRAAVPFLPVGSGVRITCTKILPTGAGLGGGSADAAAVMRGMLKLFPQPMSPERFTNIAKLLGADVPFMLEGGSAWGEGIGDLLEATDLTLGKSIVLVATPKCFVSTPEAYAGLKPNGEEKYLQIKSAVEKHGFQWLNAYNHFEKSVCVQFEQIQVLKDKMIEYGALISLLSGSGASVFGVWENLSQEKKMEIEGKLKTKCRFWAWTQFSTQKEKINFL